MNVVLVFIISFTIFVKVPHSYFHFFWMVYWRWFFASFLKFKQFSSEFFENLALQFYIYGWFSFYFHSADRAIIMLGVSVLMQTRLTETVTTQKFTWLKHKCETYRALSVYLLIISSAEDVIRLKMVAPLIISNRFGFHNSTPLDFRFEIIVGQRGLSRHETRTICCLIVL